MSQIVTQNPGSSEIQSPLIAGITEGLNKLSSVLNLKTETLEDVQLTAVPIDNDEKNKNRIFEANFGNRLWLSSPTPVIKKNGSEITQSGSNFTIDYIGGSVTFPVESKPSDGDIITVSATHIIADSESLNAINNTLSAVQTQSNKYKGNYDNVEALQLAYSSAQNGDYAIVFEPLAVYAWKNDGWYDTRSIEDLSDYYNKEETNNLLNQKEPKISSKGSSTSDDNYYWGGRKTWQDLFAKVRSVTLTGLSTASDAVVSATDTVLTAIGKLQAQVSKNTQKAYLSGTGAPSTSTVGSVGQRYVNTSTSDEYICEEVSGGTYTWKLQVKSVNGKTPSASGGNIRLTADDVNALGKDGTALSAESANSLNGLTKEEIEQSFGGVSLVIDGSSNSADLTSAENRIDSVTVQGFTTQDGSGDPSPTNVRPIENGGVYNAFITFDGTQAWQESSTAGTYYFLASNVSSIVPISSYLPSISYNALLTGTVGVSAAEGNTLRVRLPGNANPNTYFEAKPLKMAYRSTEDTGKFYTGIGVTQGDDYHCTIVEINDRLHEGDTLETNTLYNGMQKCVETHVKGTIILTGTETISLYQKAEDLIFLIYTSSTWSIENRNKGICNWYPVGDTGHGAYWLAGPYGKTPAGTVRLVNNSITTVEDLKSDLASKYAAGTPVTIEYELDAPEVYADAPVEIENPKGAYTVSGEDGTTVEVSVRTTPTPEEIGALPADGIAESAIKLETPINIGSASFDGSQSITLAQMGALSTSGTAAAATKLATSRKIGNASFNGSADITLAQMGAAEAALFSAPVWVHHTATYNTGTGVVDYIQIGKFVFIAVQMTLSKAIAAKSILTLEYNSSSPLWPKPAENSSSYGLGCASLSQAQSWINGEDGNIVFRIFEAANSGTSYWTSGFYISE